MTDEQLIDYCVAQCRTPVGKISGDMIARLHELAHQGDAAEIARKQAWWQLEPAHIDAVAKTAKAFLVYDNSASGSPLASTPTVSFTDGGSTPYSLDVAGHKLYGTKENCEWFAGKIAQGTPMSAASETREKEWAAMFDMGNFTNVPAVPYGPRDQAERIMSSLLDENATRRMNIRLVWRYKAIALPAGEWTEFYASLPTQAEPQEPK